MFVSMTLINLNFALELKLIIICNNPSCLFYFSKFVFYIFNMYFIHIYLDLFIYNHNNNTFGLQVRRSWSWSWEFGP
jgi:hypothetical protein